MENDQEEVVLEADNDVEETTDWKAKHDELAGRLKRAETKLKKSEIESKVEEKVQKTLESKGLDKVDRLFLRQEGIKSAEEIALAEEWVKDTGRGVESILESKAFKAELKELRDSLATKEATPSSTKRSGQSPRDEVDYWIAKGELPKDNRELALKVVNAQLQREKSKNTFADQAVII